MSTENLMERLAQRLSRRKAVMRLGAAVTGSVAALFGFGRDAGAISYWRCCTLCKPNSGSCSGCTCVWCWSCLWNGAYQNCCECYDSNGTWCTNDNYCTRAKCSFAYQRGSAPAP